MASDLGGKVGKLRSHRRGHWFEPSIAHPDQTPFSGRSKIENSGKWEHYGSIVTVTMLPGPSPRASFVIS